MSLTFFPSHLTAALQATRSEGFRSVLGKQSTLAQIVAHGLQAVGQRDALAESLVLRRMVYGPPPQSPLDYRVVFSKETAVSFVSWNAGSRAWFPLEQAHAPGEIGALPEAVLAESAKRLELFGVYPDLGRWVVVQATSRNLAELLMKPDDSGAMVKKTRVLHDKIKKDLAQAKNVFASHLEKALRVRGAGHFFSDAPAPRPAATVGEAWRLAGREGEAPLREYLVAGMSPPEASWVVGGAEGLWVRSSEPGADLWGERVLVIGASPDTRALLADHRLRSRLVQALPSAPAPARRRM